MDYCTLWFEGWWAHCCAAHDLGYASGELPQAVLDAVLRACVADSGAWWLSAPIAGAMYIAVRVFGRFYYKR